MDLLSKEKVLKVMSVTRFHFIAGMPLAGADDLALLLAQNPKFAVKTDSPAASLMAESLKLFAS